MIGLGFPHTTDEYKDFKKNRSSIYSDGSLTILNSNMNPNYIITFTDLFPTSLSELIFDSELTDVDPIKATVSFQYLTYTWKKV
jgi:hypothetical protein